MSTCENCGKTFERVDAVEEVTTLRVLCPQCSAERAAAKARKAGLPANARPPAAAANAVPRDGAAAKPPAAMPARRLQARAEAPAPVAKPAPKAAAPRPPAPAPAPHVARNDRPAARATPPKKKKVEVELHSQELQKRGTRESLVAFGGALLVLVVAGVVLYFVLGKKSAEKA